MGYDAAVASVPPLGTIIKKRNRFLGEAGHCKMAMTGHLIGAESMSMRTTLAVVLLSLVPPQQSTPEIVTRKMLASPPLSGSHRRGAPLVSSWLHVRKKK